VLSEELCILPSCFLSPMSNNSVLEELRTDSSTYAMFQNARKSEFLSSNS